MKVEEQYFDVLQNIETAVVSAYEIDARLLDLDVLDALDVLIRNYALEEQGVGARTSRLSGPAQRVHDLVRRICEWRLGRQPLDTVNPPADESAELSLSGLVLCLKRLRKSVRLWNEQGAARVISTTFVSFSTMPVDRLACNLPVRLAAPGEIMKCRG